MHLNTVAEICCVDNDCSVSGFPGADGDCVSDCGSVLEPFWDDCGTMLGMLGSIPDGMPEFYDTCMARLYPPGQVSDRQFSLL
jgi:hypothetical protein